ncbi:hypothetical protein [uncultured Massilia sp.]
MAHVGAALWHAWIRRDNALAQMTSGEGPLRDGVVSRGRTPEM